MSTDREHPKTSSQSQTQVEREHHTTLSSTPAPKPGVIANTAKMASGQGTDFFTTMIGTFHFTSEPEEELRKIATLGNMSLHLWRLQHQDDIQNPHKQDEVYYIVEGAGNITIGGDGTPSNPGKPEPIVPGDVIFVPRSTWHRFHDFGDQGLLILVFFSPDFSGGPPIS